MPPQPDSKPILVATDMSHRSDRAMQRAFALARRNGAKVIAFTAVDDAMPEELTGDLHRRVAEHLQRHVAVLADGVAYDTRTTVGDPTAEILRAVGDIDPGLLVMGMHRIRGFLDTLRETTMQRIVRRTHHPVLLVHDPVDHDYRTVIAASDFSPASTAALRLAAELCPDATITPIHALHVPFSGMLNQTPDSRTELEAAFVKDTREADVLWRQASELPGQVRDTIIEPGPGFAVLRKAVLSADADLICVGAHGRVGAAPSILGSLASDLMRDPPCDLLIARP